MMATHAASFMISQKKTTNIFNGALKVLRKEALKGFTVHTIFVPLQIKYFANNLKHEFNNTSSEE